MSDAAKHTPGPWTIIEVAEADARLLAEAPAMVEILRRLPGLADRLADSDDDAPLWDLGRAASAILARIDGIKRGENSDE